VVITTTDGRTLEKRLDYPKGDPRNPLTDEEIAGKFAAWRRASRRRSTCAACSTPSPRRGVRLRRELMAELVVRR